jgi:hypothetical protein
MGLNADAAPKADRIVSESLDPPNAASRRAAGHANSIPPYAGRVIGFGGLVNHVSWRSGVPLPYIRTVSNVGMACTGSEAA